MASHTIVKKTTIVLAIPSRNPQFMDKRNRFLREGAREEHGRDLAVPHGPALQLARRRNPQRRRVRACR